MTKDKMPIQAQLNNMELCPEFSDSDDNIEGNCKFKKRELK